MAKAKPETQLIARVHKGLLAIDEEVYPEKTHNPFRGGIPDVYYDYPGYDLWVEYKHMERLPVTLELTSGKRPPVTSLQRRWLKRAHDNGRQVAIITGIGKGVRARFLICRVYDQFWDQAVPRDQFEPYLTDIDGVIDFLLTRMRYGQLGQG